MRKIILLIAIALVSIAAWRWKRSDVPADAAAAPTRLIANRIWLDHVPRGERDTVQAFFVHGEDAIGLFAASSQWRGRYELFRYEAGGGELRVLYPQTGERETLRVAARRCDEQGMDFCLEVGGASRGVKKYYSRKGWEVDGRRDARTIEARIEDRIEALRAELGD